MNLLQQFKDYIKEHALAEPADRLLVAVSGGVDSVVLCHLCHAAGYDFEIAHANFGLRGAESMRDEASVCQLGAALGVRVHVKSFDTGSYAASHKVSIQVAARELRYTWFEDLLPAPDAGLTSIATAHHIDDNVETVLMNFMRGTGIAGLTGMAPRRGNVIRPLLFAEKENLVEYATAAGLQWVEDSSNVSPDYTRNFLRIKVLPLLKEIYPTIAQNIAGSIGVWNDTELLYEQAIARHKKDLLSYRGSEVYIPVLKLAKAKPLHTIAYEIIKPYGFSPAQTGELLKLLDSSSGSYIRSPTHRVLKNRAWLIISPLEESSQSLVLLEPGEHVKTFDGWKFEIGSVVADTAKPPGNQSVELVDAKDLRYPLQLRKWKAGDYFYPLGMQKKKKLARFFIDQKLSLLEKEAVWVLESDKRIVWVIGYRIDNRFRITPTTTEAMRLSITRPGTGLSNG